MASSLFFVASLTKEKTAGNKRKAAGGGGQPARRRRLSGSSSRHLSPSGPVPASSFFTAGAFLDPAAAATASVPGVTSSVGSGALAPTFRLSLLHLQLPLFRLSQVQFPLTQRLPWSTWVRRIPRIWRSVVFCVCQSTSG
jgi:hypothetical protein